MIIAGPFQLNLFYSGLSCSISQFDYSNSWYCSTADLLKLFSHFFCFWTRGKRCSGSGKLIFSVVFGFEIWAEVKKLNCGSQELNSPLVEGGFQSGSDLSIILLSYYFLFWIASLCIEFQKFQAGDTHGKQIATENRLNYSGLGLLRLSVGVFFFLHVFEKGEKSSFYL